MLTYHDVQELIEGRGLTPSETQEPKNPTVLNIVLERLTDERGVYTYDDLYAMFTEAGYELDFESFLDQCDGTADGIHEDFVRGITDVLDLDYDEKLAFAWANLWGREPRAH